MTDILHPEYRRLSLTPDQASLIAALDKAALDAQGRLEVALRMVAAQNGITSEFRIVSLERDALIVDPSAKAA